MRKEFSWSAALLSCILLGALSFVVWERQSMVWWDEAIYAGMGEFFSGGGSSGMWENLRPPLIPLIVAGFEFFGVDFFVYRLLLGIVWSLLLVMLVYHLGVAVRRENYGWPVLFLLSFSPLIILSPLLLSDIPSIVLIVGSMLAAFRGRPFLAGMLGGFSVLARFPQAILLPVIILVFWYDIPWSSLKRLEVLSAVKKSLWFCAGGLLIGIPYLVAQKVVMGSFFGFFRDALVASVESSVSSSPFFYAGVLWSRSFLLLALFIVGCIVITLRARWEKRASIVIISALVMLIYLSLFSHREERYALMVLPFLAVIAGHGCVTILERGRLWQHAILSASMGMVLVAGIVSGVSDTLDAHPPISEEWKDFYSYGSTDRFESFQIILATDPQVMVFTRHPVRFFGGMRYARQELERWRIQAALISWNSCAYKCDAVDDVCSREKIAVEREFERFVMVLNESVNGCSLRVYDTRITKQF